MTQQNMANFEGMGRQRKGERVCGGSTVSGNTSALIKAEHLDFANAVLGGNGTKHSNTVLAGYTFGFVAVFTKKVTVF